MTKKIFRSILTVGVAVLACSLLLVMGCFYSFYEGMQEHQLGDELRIAAAAVETNGSTYLEKIKSDRFRVTWIASDGTVLYDTQADAAQMENHLEREEVREARAARAATARRCCKRPFTARAASRTAPCCACPPAAPRWARCCSERSSPFCSS